MSQLIRSRAGRLTPVEQEHHDLAELKIAIAAEHGLPAELAKRLDGSTAEELAADAASLASAARPAAGKAIDELIRGAAGKTAEPPAASEREPLPRTSFDGGVRGEPPGRAEPNVDDRLRAHRLEVNRQVEADAEGYRAMREASQ